VRYNDTKIDSLMQNTGIVRNHAKDLPDRGANFVGPTIIYAFMQATGMVNDHLVDCHCHAKCAVLGREPHVR
jgi:DNA-3-methyladenine glycosylase I